MSARQLFALNKKKKRNKTIDQIVQLAMNLKPVNLLNEIN